MYNRPRNPWDYSKGPHPDDVAEAMREDLEEEEPEEEEPEEEEPEEEEPVTDGSRDWECFPPQGHE